jgi:diketogulonate reductase-like aldo/keto reductase
MLNWAVVRGTVPIPKSGTLANQQANIDVFDFKLTEEEVASIEKDVNCGFRICE